MLIAAGLMFAGIAPLGAEPGAAAAFRIGFVSEDGNSAAVEGLSAIEAAYARALARPVEIFVAKDYAALAEAQIDGRLDYAVYSATAFAAAGLRCGCLTPVAAPVARNGSVGLRAVLIERAGAEGTEARIALAPDGDLAGNLVPMAAWPEAGAATGNGRIVAARSASDAEGMFVDGEADGFFGWIAAWRQDAAAPAGGSVARLRQAGLEPGDYRIAWRSEPLHYGPHAVHRDVDAETVERLRDFLTGLSPLDGELVRLIDRRHGGGFVAVTIDDYAPVIEAVAALRERNGNAVAASTP